MVVSSLERIWNIPFLEGQVCQGLPFSFRFRFRCVSSSNWRKSSRWAPLAFLFRLVFVLLPACWQTFWFSGFISTQILNHTLLYKSKNCYWDGGCRLACKHYSYPTMQCCHTWPERILRSKSSELQCILISGTHWFQKCNYWKCSMGFFSIVTMMPFETLSKTKTMKILLWKVIKTGGCPVDFILNYIFEISGFLWSIWAIDCPIFRKLFQIFNIQPPRLLTKFSIKFQKA